MGEGDIFGRSGLTVEAEPWLRLDSCSLLETTERGWIRSNEDEATEEHYTHSTMPLPERALPVADLSLRLGLSLLVFLSPSKLTLFSREGVEGVCMIDFGVAVVLAGAIPRKVN